MPLVQRLAIAIQQPFEINMCRGGSPLIDSFIQQVFAESLFYVKPSSMHVGQIAQVSSLQKFTFQETN